MVTDVRIARSGHSYTGCADVCARHDITDVLLRVRVTDIGLHLISHVVLRVIWHMLYYARYDRCCIAPDMTCCITPDMTDVVLRLI